MEKQFIELKFKTGKTMTIPKRHIISVVMNEGNPKEFTDIIIVGDGTKQTELLIQEEYHDFIRRLGTDETYL